MESILKFIQSKCNVSLTTKKLFLFSLLELARLADSMARHQLMCFLNILIRRSDDDHKLLDYVVPRSIMLGPGCIVDNNQIIRGQLKIN